MRRRHAVDELWMGGGAHVGSWWDEAGVAKEMEGKVYSMHFSFRPYVGVV